MLFLVLPVSSTANANTVKNLLFKFASTLSFNYVQLNKRVLPVFLSVLKKRCTWNLEWSPNPSSFVEIMASA